MKSNYNGVFLGILTMNEGEILDLETDVLNSHGLDNQIYSRAAF